MKLFIRLLIGWLCCSVSVLAQTPTPVAANGQLKVINRQLSNQSGKAIQLRGMSSHGLQYFPNCFTASSVQTLARDWGIDVFRSAMYVDEGGYVTDKAKYRAFVDNLVDWTGQNGVYNIIDWHILNPGNPNDHLADAKEFFQIEAQKHAGKKHVIYEICNEPHDVDWATIKGYAEQIIPIIRTYDKEAIILVGTPGYSGQPGDVRSNPLTGSNAYNVMYTFHFYAGSHYTQSYIDDVLKTVPLFISEWGTSNYTGNGGNDYTNSQNWVNLMAGQNSSGIKVSWCNWNFSDNSESSAALNPGACNSGNWNNTSTSGAWVKERILNPADDFGPATPSVAITSPATSTTVATGSRLVITAAVSNTTAASVDFYKGSTRLGGVTTAPYSWTIGSVQAGTYSFTVKALFSGGSSLTSSAVQVTAATPPANKPPTVSLTSPANSATLTAPATVNIAANADDSDGSVSNVEFFSGSTKIGEDGSAPYQYTWSAVPAGTYTISAKATDNKGAVTTSTTVTIQVKTASTNPPTNSGADLIGPDCARLNEVLTYEVNDRNLPNATNFSWWFSGSTQSISPGPAGKATYNFGPNFTGGQLCVGINYSAAPWYQQFCKNVAVCASARVGEKQTTENVVYPNPSSGEFTFVADRDIQAMQVADEAGRERLKLGNTRAGQSVTFGAKLPLGTYLFQIQYEKGEKRTIKLLKTE